MVAPSLSGRPPSTSSSRRRWRRRPRRLLLRLCRRHPPLRHQLHRQRLRTRQPHSQQPSSPFAQRPRRNPLRSTGPYRLPRSDLSLSGQDVDTGLHATLSPRLPPVPLPTGGHDPVLRRPSSSRPPAGQMSRNRHRRRRHRDVGSAVLRPVGLVPSATPPYRPCASPSCRVCDVRTRPSTSFSTHPQPGPRPPLTKAYRPAAGSERKAFAWAPVTQRDPFGSLRARRPVPMHPRDMSGNAIAPCRTHRCRQRSP